MSIKSFFRNSGNSHARENILNYKLQYDLSLAAAEFDYELHFYTPNTDHEGVDLILDDHRSIQKVQIKTVLHDASTGNWSIHTRLLSPELINEKPFGIPAGGSHGLEGGVIIMSVTTTIDSVSVDYYYTDLYVITLFHFGLIDRKSTKTQPLASKLMTTLRKKGVRDVKVPWALFIKIKDSHSLLSMMGLLSKNSQKGMALRSHTRNYAEANNAAGQKQPIDPKLFLPLLAELTDDKLIYPKS